MLNWIFKARNLFDKPGIIPEVQYDPEMTGNLIKIVIGE